MCDEVIGNFFGFLVLFIGGGVIYLILEVVFDVKSIFEVKWIFYFYKVS